MTNIAIENGHRNSEFSHSTRSFSIAMLVHQRVCGIYPSSRCLGTTTPPFLGVIPITVAFRPIPWACHNFLYPYRRSHLSKSSQVVSQKWRDWSEASPTSAPNGLSRRTSTRSHESAELHFWPASTDFLHMDEDIEDVNSTGLVN